MYIPTMLLAIFLVCILAIAIFVLVTGLREVWKDKTFPRALRILSIPGSIAIVALLSLFAIGTSTLIHDDYENFVSDYSSTHSVPTRMRVNDMTIDKHCTSITYSPDHDAKDKTSEVDMSDFGCHVEHPVWNYITHPSLTAHGS